MAEMAAKTGKRSPKRLAAIKALGVEEKANNRGIAQITKEHKKYADFKRALPRTVFHFYG